MKNLKVSVVGLGYLGATQAIVLASQGFQVIGIDVDEQKISSLQKGQVPFYEPGLAELLQLALESGKVSFTSAYSDALADVDIHFICVGTPLGEDGSEIDTKYVLEAAASIAEHAKPDSILVGRSTVPPGTATKIRDLISGSGKVSPKIAWNPEFLSEGTAVMDFLKPDRVVVGVEDEFSERLLQEVYQDFLDDNRPFLSMSLASAELAKVAANSFLAMKVSFINGVASVAEASGASTRELALALGMDPRIGNRFLSNGLGFGGGCLPKDISGFAETAKRSGNLAFANMLQGVIDVNNDRVETTLSIITRLTKSFTNPKIAVLGATFKGNTDDLRNSPAMFLVNRLKDYGFDVRIHDPMAGTDDIESDIWNNLEKVVEGVDVLVTATDWKEYKQLRAESLERYVARKIIVDTRGIIDSDSWVARDWKVLRLGEGQDFDG